MRTPVPVCSGQWFRCAEAGSSTSPLGVVELSTTGRLSTEIGPAQRVRTDVPTVVRHGSPITSCNQRKRQRPRPRPGLGRARPWRSRPRTRTATVVPRACRRRSGGFAPSGGRPHGRCVRRAGRAARAGGGFGPRSGLGPEPALDAKCRPDYRFCADPGFALAPDPGAGLGAGAMGEAGSGTAGADSGVAAAQMWFGTKNPCRTGRCPDRGRGLRRGAFLVRAPPLRTCS